MREKIIYNDKNTTTIKNYNKFFCLIKKLSFICLIFEKIQTKEKNKYD